MYKEPNLQMIRQGVGEVGVGWGSGGAKVVVEVGVASSLKPVNKLDYAGEVGVIQQLCKTNVGSASEETGERQNVQQYT